MTSSGRKRGFIERWRRRRHLRDRRLAERVFGLRPVAGAEPDEWRRDAEEEKAA